MFLRITTTYRPATDLGYLLAKHPERVQEFSLNFGSGHVFFPERDEERCSAILLLDIDPITLVRKRGAGRGSDAFPLRQYVNDRPYVASSLLSVALLQIFRSALNGRSNERPELVTTPIPLEFELPVVPSRDGEELLDRLFRPLGYDVESSPLPLDTEFPEWGPSRYYRVVLRTTAPLAEALGHLYVLLPVLDNEKHYWIDRTEVEKLLKRGEGWLATHPEAELISRRYLLRKGYLVDEARERLSDDSGEDLLRLEEAEEALKEREATIGLHDIRLDRVTELIRHENPTRVIDLGCGEGKLIERLLRDSSIGSVTGVDVSASDLLRAERKIERLPEIVRNRVSLMLGSLLYRDERFAGYDVAALVEVIEHIEPERLPTFEQVVFGEARPGVVLLTTPNREYNVVWEQLSAGTARHADHRFEWTRAEFLDWTHQVAEEYGYEVTVEPLGPASPDHPHVGSPSQLAVFRQCR